MREKIWNNLDIVLGILGVLGGLITLIIGLKLSNAMLQQVSSILIFAVLIYFFCRRTLQKKEEASIIISNSHQKFLYSTITFQILFIFALVLYYTGDYSRPLLFLIVASIMAGCLAVSICAAATSLQSLLILFEILALGILLRATAYFQFPTMIGGDPWAHASWIQSLSIMGNTVEAMAAYQSFPLMHIFVASLHDITDLAIKDSMAFVGLCEVLSLMFLYLIGRKFFDEKVGLIATLLLALSASHVLYGYLIIPQTFGVALIPMLFFLLFLQKVAPNNKSRYNILTVIVLVALLFTHTITSFAALVILSSVLAMLVITNLLSPKQVKRSNILLFTMVPLLFSILIIGYWGYASNFSGFILDSIRWGFSSADLAPAASAISAMSNDFVYSLMRQSPLYITILFAIIGSLYILKWKKSLIYMLSGWGIVVFVYITVFLGLHSFLPGRWLVFISLALFIPLTIPFVILTNTVSRKSVFLFVIVAFFALVMVTNYEANVTNVNPLTPYPTQALRSSEVVSAKTLANVVPPTVDLYGDVYTLRFGNAERQIIDGSAVYANNQDFSGVLLLRRELMNNVFFAPSSGESSHLSIARFDPSAAQSIQKGWKIYDCGTVTAIGKVRT